MSSGPGGGVSAAPNLARIGAICEQAVRSADSPRKWMLGLRIESVEVLYGGTFVRAGEQVDAIAFDLPVDPVVGARIYADAEYLGGPRGGEFRLYDVAPG